MCDCITKLTDDIRLNIKTQTEERTQVVTWDDPGNFQNKVTIGDVNTVVIPFRFAYTRRKNSGEPEKKITNDSINITPKFCPFCGEAIKKE